MRIDVIGDDRISLQARTYAEYRVFAVLTQSQQAEHVRHVRVLLRPVSSGHEGEEIACTVTVTLEGSESLRIRTTGPHAYAVINRAVERLRTHATQAGVSSV